jgi:hypothetical protein
MPTPSAIVGTALCLDSLFVQPYKFGREQGDQLPTLFEESCTIFSF